VQNAIPVWDAISAGALFLVIAGWPASALALISQQTCVLCARQCKILGSRGAHGEASRSPAVSAISVHFYFLTDLPQDLSGLRIAIAPDDDFWMLAQVNHKSWYRSTRTYFLLLLAPPTSSVKAIGCVSQLNVRGMPRCVFLAYRGGPV